VYAIDGRSTVMAMWTGNVTPEREETLSGDLLSGTTKPLYTRVASADVVSYAKSAGTYRILAFRKPRNAVFPGAKYVVIPSDEVAARAVYEFSPGSSTFVDCKTASSANACQNTLLELAVGEGPGPLFAIDLPRRSQTVSGEQRTIAAKR
jgi:hypothetical protein